MMPSRLERGEGVTRLGERAGREGEGVEGATRAPGDERTMSNEVCDAWSTNDWARSGIRVAAAMAGCSSGRERV